MSVILNVDDDTVARYTKSRILKLAGYEVIEGTTGNQALELALARAPDLILLDMKLPDLNGLEVCQRLKSDPRTRTMPVLQISATFIGIEERVQGLEGGADAYLTAPVEPPVLLATVRALLRARGFERELVRSQRMLDDFFENAPAGLQWLDQGGAILRANQAQLDLVGCPREAYVGQSFSKFFLDPGQAADMLRRLAGGETIREQPVRLLHCDGSVRDVLITANVLWEDGQFVHARCFIRDVSELKRLSDERERTSAALFESQEQFRRAMLAAPFPIMIHAEGGEIVALNEAWTERSGFARAEIPTIKHWLSKAYGERCDEAQAHIDRLYELQAGVDEGESVIRTRSGEERVWQFSSAPLGNTSDGRRLVISIAADITERKETERALRESEQRFRSVAELMPQIVWTMLPDGTVDYCNRRALEYTGKADLLGERGWEAMHPDDLQATHDAWRHALRTGEELSLEHRLRRHDGEYHWFLHRGLPLRDDEGRVIKWFGTATDIHDQKRIQHELERRGRSLQLLSDVATRLLLEDPTPQLLREVFESVGQHIGALVYFNFLVTPDGDRLKLEAFGGIDEATARDLEFLEFGQGYCGYVAQHRERVVAEEVQNLDDARADLVRPLGVKAYVCHPLLVRDRLIGTLSFGTHTRTRFKPDELDLLRIFCDQVAMALERTRLTAELRQRAEQLAAANRAKDDFLAVLSHELRTPLNSISLWAQYLAEENPDTAVVKQGLDEIGQSVRMQTRLVEDLLDVSRIVAGKMELHRQLVRLPEVVDAAIGTVRSAARSKGLTLKCTLEPLIGPVLGDPARLQQVIWNLLANAIKFTPPSGTVEVTLHQVDTCAEIIVRDTGQGIPPDVLPNIFLRFWQADSSIRRQHTGLGLGLAIVHHLVELHGGSIRAMSPGEDQGATFAVTLPLAPEGHMLADAVGPEPDSVEHAGPRLDGIRVLVVDDEAPTASLVKRILEARGAKVATATSAAGALELLEGWSPHVLLSDLAMPGQDGYELLRQIRSREMGGKPLPAAALTALARPDDRQRAIVAGFQEFITKPVDPRQLLQVAETLAAGLDR